MVYLLKSLQKNNAKAFKPSHYSKIFYITVQNNAELKQSRSMAEKYSLQMEKSRQLTKLVLKIDLVLYQLKLGFKTVFFCTIYIGNGPERGQRESCVESKLTVESEKY